MSPFEIIGHLSSETESNWDDVGDKEYNAFMVNRGMSYYLDCVMLANEMNRLYSAPKKNQYDFYLFAISPKKKRFAKWSSAKKDAETQLVAEYFQLSMSKAASVRSLLSDSEMKEITEKMNKGGVNK